MDAKELLVTNRPYKDGVKMSAKDILMATYPYNLIIDLNLDPDEINPVWFMRTMDVTLTERESIALELKYSEHMTHKTIGEMFGRSGSSVGEIIARAKRKMKNPVIASKFTTVSSFVFDKLEKKLFLVQRELRKLHGNVPFDPEDDEFLEDLDFSTRTFNCLYRFGVRKLSDIAGMTQFEISRISNLGSKSFNEIMDKLRAYDIDIPKGGVSENTHGDS